MNISVIVPVYNGGEDLKACLAAIAASQSAPFELLVVDDGSTDDSIVIAESYGARIAHSGGVRQGPAKARNAGAAVAHGDVLFFLDADVCPHPDAITRVREAFVRSPDLAAVIGAYDENPFHPGFFSQYKNLQHCFVHRQGRRAASTFWTGCGAIRRDVFLALGGFDAVTYPRPSIEDIELGYRMIAQGYRIELDPAIQVQHRKHWTFAGMVRTDFRDRAIPWTLLMLRTSSAPPNDLNLRTSQRVSAALTGLLVLWIAASPQLTGFGRLAGIALLAAIIGLNWSFYRFLASRRGLLFAIAAIPVHLLYFLYSMAGFACAHLIFRLNQRTA
jgi:glycosyltransferase involved in cell wall biosynthesis